MDPFYRFLTRPWQPADLAPQSQLSAGESGNGPANDDGFAQYKLYNRLGSGGFVIEAALTLAGQNYVLRTVNSVPDMSLDESFHQTNRWMPTPRMQVPVLILPDGTSMTETAAILIYIAATHPDRKLGPAPGTQDHPKFLRWLVFLSANVYEGTLRRSYPARYSTNLDDVEGIKKAAKIRNSEAFALLDREIQSGGHLLGSALSLADVYLAMLFAWHVDHERFPNCQALTLRVAAHDVIAPIWQRNFDHRLAIKWGRPF